MNKIAVFILIILFLFLSCDSEITEPSGENPITITSPENNSNVSGIVNVTTVVGSGYFFNRVDFYVDSDSVYTDDSFPYSYDWNTTIYENGSEHDLIVIAYDDTSSYVSTSIRVTVSELSSKVPITIISPVDSSSVYGPVNIQTTVGEGYTFLQVDFYVDGDSMFTDTILPFEYLWDTDIYSDSSQHFLQVEAFDSTKSYLSDTVNVTIIRPPPIAITSPANNATVSDTVTVVAAAGYGYTFNRVDFYVDNDSVYSDNTSPYIYQWDTSIYGDNTQHQLKAIAYDNSTSYISDTVNVTVVTSLTGEFGYVATFSLPGPGKRVALEGGHLFIAAGSEGMYAIDVTNPYSPEQLFLFNSPGDAQGIDSDSPYLVLADGTNGIQLFDISDPDTVLQANFFNTQGSSRNVKVVNDMVYTADNDALQIAAISGSNINPVARLPLSGGQVIDVDVINANAYVLDENGLTVVDVSTAGSPDIIDRYTAFTGLCQSVFAIDDYVFVGTTERLYLLSASTPSNISEITSYSEPTGITGIFASSSTVFASKGGSNGGALAFDYANGSSLVQLDQYLINEFCNDITISGSYVYLACQTKIEILSF